MTNANRTMAAGATMILTLALTVAAFAQANEPDAYGDGYQSGAYGRIRVADGGATIVRADSESGEPDRADVNAPLFPGDRVGTGREQRVEVQLGGGTIVRIDRGTEVVFQSLPSAATKYQDNAVLVLNSGVVRITSRLGEKEEFRVDTRDASVYLLGNGEFRIDADDRGGTRVTSVRGVAEVVANDASVLVRGGMRTVARGGSPPDEPVAASAFASDGFDQWCDARDGAYRAHDRAPRNEEERASLPEEVRPYYSELSNQGSWTEVPDYGAVWSPSGMASGWRPYSDGYWSYGPGGYFWVSSEPWGWAPYHYGNWQWIPLHGWCWIPGHVFAGAWVSWSWGSLYVGWAPLDVWGRPAWLGGAYYNGYYDPGCWTFVGYDHIHGGNVHRYAVPVASVRGDLSRATVVARAPRVDPKRLAASQEWRDRALREVADDHAARMRPIGTDRTPTRRLSDIQDHLMRRPTAAAPPVRRADDGPTTPSVERRTVAPRARRILEDPRSADRREVRPEAEAGVRDLYQRMSRPRETRRQENPGPDRASPSLSFDERPRHQAPEAPRPDAPRHGEPRLDFVRPEGSRPQPRVEAPRMQQPPSPHAQAPRPEVSRPQAPRPEPPEKHAQPQQKHGGKH